MSVYRGYFSSIEQLEMTYPVGLEGDTANVDSGVLNNPITYTWDINDYDWKKEELTDGNQLRNID